jgi:hypothetical protein
MAEWQRVYRVRSDGSVVDHYDASRTTYSVTCKPVGPNGERRGTWTRYNNLGFFDQTFDVTPRGAIEKYRRQVVAQVAAARTKVATLQQLLLHLDRLDEDDNRRVRTALETHIG